MVLQSTVVNAQKLLRTGCPVHWCADICGRTGWSVIGRVLPEDLVVLEAGSDGLVSNEAWSC